MHGIALLVLMLGICLLGRPQYVPYEFKIILFSLEITRGWIIGFVCAASNLMAVLLISYLWCRRCCPEPPEKTEEEYGFPRVIG
ncbi:MAG: hypothetical protein V1814_02180 [Candidatus Moraniibacteriota bacterium]